MSLVLEFNQTIIMFLDFLYSITKDTDLTFYKKVISKISTSEKNKMIEQFIINCLPYYQQIQNKDDNFFLNFNSDNLNNKSLLKVIKIKTIFKSLSLEEKNMIYQYLILLSNYGKQYMKSYKLGS